MSKVKDMVKIDSRLLESILREREITKSELSRKIGEKRHVYLENITRRNYDPGSIRKPYMPGSRI